MTWVPNQSLIASLGYKVFNTPLYVWITGMSCTLTATHKHTLTDNLSVLLKKQGFYFLLYILNITENSHSQNL